MRVNVHCNADVCMSNHNLVKGEIKRIKLYRAKGDLL